jgi:hypothetical protein
MSAKPLSATMAAGLADIIERGGKIIRHQGGWWTEPGATPRATIGHPFDWWIGGSTVQALVRRGEIEYTEWKQGRGLNFPIAAAVRKAVEIECYPCHRCGTGVETRWACNGGGMLSDPNSTLVADWVFHSSCWDGLLRESPPGEASAASDHQRGDR